MTTLAVSQLRGDLRPPPGQTLPPFERWAFRRRHYVQYLADQLTLHHALESATLAAMQPRADGLGEKYAAPQPDANSGADPGALSNTLALDD